MSDKPQYKQGDAIIFWTVDTYSPKAGVRVGRVVYYEDAEHKDVEGSYSDQGARWVKQWATYSRTLGGGWHLGGRVDGDIQEWLQRIHAYFNAREAWKAWKQYCENRCAAIGKELGAWAQAVEKAEAFLAQ